MVAEVEKVSRKSVSSRVEWMKGWASWVIFQGTSVSSVDGMQHHWTLEGGKSVCQDLG